MNINEQANFIWSIADLLRGDFKQSEYGKVILPFTVLRRFDCVLAPSKAKILEANKTLTVSNKRPIFKRMTGHDYYNVSQFDFEKLMDDSNAIEANLRDYINGFSEDVREIMDNFEIFGVIDRLSRANLLYLVVQRFAEIDMSDTQIDNLEMGYMFDYLTGREVLTSGFVGLLRKSPDQFLEHISHFQIINLGIAHINLRKTLHDQIKQIRP